MNRSLKGSILIAALIGTLSGAGSARAAIATALIPASQTVTPGAQFDLFFDVTAAGTAFNGYDLVVEFDPAALTLVPLAPTTSQQGCLMTGGCSAACGNTFHVFNAAGDSAAVSNVLLCNAQALTGPGRLYKLRFQASNVVQSTTVRVRRARFYNAGLFVGPVTKLDALVGIGVSLGVDDLPGKSTGAWRAEPNPSAGRIEFRSEGDASGLVTGEVLDLQGRVLHQWSPVWVGARGRLAWNGQGADGARLPAGLYLVRLRRGQQVETTRVTLLP
jgi:hypothetical protein